MRPEDVALLRRAVDPARLAAELAPQEPEFTCGLFGLKLLPVGMLVEPQEVFYPGYFRPPLAPTVSWSPPAAADRATLGGCLCCNGDHWHVTEVRVFDRRGLVRWAAALPITTILHPGRTLTCRVAGALAALSRH